MGSGSIMDYGPEAHLTSDGTVVDPGPTPSPHAKGRDCARTEEVLENYRKRALLAEARLATATEGWDVEWLTECVEDCRRLLREQSNPELETVVEAAAQVLLVLDPDGTKGSRQVCPEHGISDCSPLLNGCSRLSQEVADER